MSDHLLGVVVDAVTFVIFALLVFGVIAEIAIGAVTKVQHAWRTRWKKYAKDDGETDEAVR